MWEGHEGGEEGCCQLLQQDGWPLTKVEEGLFVEKGSKKCSQDIWREIGGKEGSKIFSCFPSLLNG